jgi:hypothetical protein
MEGRVPLDRLVVAAGVDTPSVLTRIVHEGPSGLSFKQMADGSLVGTDAPEPPEQPQHAAILAAAGDFPNEALRELHGNRILTRIAFDSNEGKNRGVRGDIGWIGQSCADRTGGRRAGRSRLN